MQMCSATLFWKSHQAFRLLFDGSGPLVLKSRWEQFLLGRSISGEKTDTTLMNIEEIREECGLVGIQAQSLEET